MDGSKLRFSFLFLVYFFTTCFAKSIGDGRSYGIINGHLVNIKDVPFFAIFRPKGDIWGCGASIVHEQFLVTAAHCTNTTVEFEVVVGTDKIRPGHGEAYEVETQFVHPNRCGNDYDIAVIKLKKKLYFNKKVKMIKIADSTTQVKKGDRVQTFGFGMTEPVNNYSEVLRGVNMEIVDHDKCAKAYTEFNLPVTKRMTCAGSNVLGPSHADSGGALLFRDLLIGVVSWRLDLPDRHRPVVFADIPSMRDFIDETIEENI